MIATSCGSSGRVDAALVVRGARGGLSVPTSGQTGRPRRFSEPQCHIIASAKEQNEVVASVGYQLSRVRTGILNEEMTCAIPASRLPEVIAKLKATAQADNPGARPRTQSAFRI